MNTVYMYQVSDQQMNRMRKRSGDLPRWATRQLRYFTATLVIVILLSGCSRDEFSAPSIELQERLSDFRKSKNASPVYAWVTQYHGEAPGHQMMITFVEWGNMHVSEMNVLLKTWPMPERNRIFDLLKWAAADSGQPIKFIIPQAAQQSGAGDAPTGAPDL